ncbi:hypothetical protein DRQ50_07955 [bacterium]|nr:MAG: hypothetical protein DRQ50_07955 [bacterium]
MKVLVIAVLLLVTGTSVTAGLLDLTLHADEFIVGEAFAVTVQGYLHDSCWSLEGHSVHVGDGVINFNVSTLIVNAGCLPYIDYYTVDEMVTAPTPGEWLLRAVEIHVTPGGTPRPDEVLEIMFTVVAPVRGEATSWGAIKALYN